MCRLFGFGRISRRGRSRAGGGVFGWYPARPPTEPSLVMRSSSAAFCASLTVGSGPSHRRLGQASRAWALPNRATSLRRSSKRLASSFSQWASSSGSTLGLRRLLCRRRLRRVVGPRRRVHLAETRRARRGCTHCRAPANDPAVCVIKSRLRRRTGRGQSTQPLGWSPQPKTWRNSNQSILLVAPLRSPIHTRVYGQRAAVVEYACAVRTRGHAANDVPAALKSLLFSQREPRSPSIGPRRNAQFHISSPST